jgi:chromosome segregation ATPase
MNASLLPTMRSASLSVPLLYSANVPHLETMLFNEFKVPEQAIALQVTKSQQPAVANCHTFVPPSLQPVLAELQSKDAGIRALNSDLNDQQAAIITLNNAQEVLKTGKESNEEEIQVFKNEKDMESEVGQIRQSNEEHRAELAKQRADSRVKAVELLRLRGGDEERIRQLDEQMRLLENQRNEEMLSLKAEIKKLEKEMKELKRLNRVLELSSTSKEKIEMSEKKIEELKVDNQVLEESQRLERKCNILELEVEGFREWKPKRDMELDTLQKDLKIFDAEKKSLIVQCDEIKMREHSLLATVQGLVDTK